MDRFGLEVFERTIQNINSLIEETNNDENNPDKIKEFIYSLKKIKLIIL